MQILEGTASQPLTEIAATGRGGEGEGRVQRRRRRAMVYSVCGGGCEFRAGCKEVAGEVGVLWRVDAMGHACIPAALTGTGQFTGLLVALLGQREGGGVGE